MRTVVAVTDPLVAAEPNAVTQSPTARSVDAADCVELTGVELVVVTLTVSVLGGVRFVVLVFLEPFAFLEVELLDLGKLPGVRSMPVTVRVVPFTAVTFPEAMSIDPRAFRKLLEPDRPPGKLGRVPPLPPLVRKKPPPPVPAPKRKPGFGPVPPVPVRTCPVQDPDALGMVTVMVRAATVFFEFLGAVPVTVTQSPVLTELTVSDTVLENCVVGVQLTVV
jgi:hypothetical protein